jgi:hypothetical protein
MIASKWRAVCLVIAVLVPSIGGAQDPARTTVMRSGLHSFFDGHSALLTVSENATGKSASLVTAAGSSQVTIEFRDDTDRPVASITGWLTRGKPVRLEMPVHAAIGLAQFSATVTVAGPANESSAIMAVLEDVDLTSRTVSRIIGGGPQTGPFDPKGVSYLCPPPGWHVTFFPNPAGG